MLGAKHVLSGHRVFIAAVTSIASFAIAAAELTSEDLALIDAAANNWPSTAKCRYQMSVSTEKQSFLAAYDPFAEQAIRITSLNGLPPPDDPQKLHELRTRISGPSPLEGWFALVGALVLSDPQEQFSLDHDGAQKRTSTVPNSPEDIQGGADRRRVINSSNMQVAERASDRLVLTSDVSLSFSIQTESGAVTSRADGVDMKFTFEFAVDPPHLRRVEEELKKPFSPRRMTKISRFYQLTELEYDEALQGAVIRHRLEEVRGRAMLVWGIDLRTDQTYSNFDCQKPDTVSSSIESKAPALENP